MKILHQEQLHEWLKRALEPICDADPAVLSEYVIALLKHDKSNQDIKNTCISQLEDFLKRETIPFVDLLFSTLNDNSYFSDFRNVSDSVLANEYIPDDRTSAYSNRRDDRDGREFGREGRQHDRDLREYDRDRDYRNNDYRERFEDDRYRKSKRGGRYNDYEERDIERSTSKEMEKSFKRPLDEPQDNPHRRKPYDRRPRRPPSDTIVVENIPQEYINVDAINGYFKNFGVLVHINVNPFSKSAVIKYSSQREAINAHSSPDPIFGNRFVKVYFQDDGISPPQNNGTGTNNVRIASQNDLNPVKPLTAIVDEKRTKLLELSKQNDEFIQKQLEYQKELMDKLTQKDHPLSDKEKAELIAAFKTSQELTESTLSLSSTSIKNVGVVPRRLTPQERKKVLLDKELELLGKTDTETGDTEALKKQLDALEAEARSLGVGTTFPPPPFRGRGRGRGRGYGRYMRGSAFGIVPRSFKLDNRTRRLQVAGITNDMEASLRAEIESCGKVVALEYNDVGVVIEFAQRVDAEKLVVRGIKDEDGKLRAMNWHEQLPTETSAMEEDRDEEAVSWKRK